MTNEIKHKLSKKQTLAAAISVLGVSLGVSIPANAQPMGTNGPAPDTMTMSNHKYAGAQHSAKTWGAGDQSQSNQLKLDSTQQKWTSSQLKLDSAQHKLNSNQIKLDSTQQKLDSNQIKLDSATGSPQN